MTRRRLSQALATFLGAVAPLTALLDPRCDGSVFKGELQPFKSEINGLKVNVNLGGSNGEAAEPPPHQQSGAPPGSYGTAIVCTPIEGTDKVDCSTRSE